MAGHKMPSERISLKAYIVEGLDPIVRAAVAAGADDAQMSKAVSDFLRDPRVAVRIGKAAPHERLAMRRAVPTIQAQLKALHSSPARAGFATILKNYPGLGAAELDVRLQAATPEAVHALLSTGFSTVIAAADDVLQATAGETPTQQELAAWIADSGCPPEALEEVAERCETLWGLPPGSVRVTGWAFGGLTTWRNGEEFHATVGDLPRDSEAAEKPFPLFPLVTAWQARPRRVELAPPDKRRMLPGRLAMGREGDPRVPKLYSPAVHTITQPNGGQEFLPGFERSGMPDIALPLELWRLGGGRQVTRGRGVPWAMRGFWAALSHTAAWDRHGRHAVLLDITLRDFLKWMYPESKRPAERQWWSSFQRAIADLESQDARIPVWKPDTQTWARRRVVSVPEYPDGPSEMDGPIIFRIDLPSSSQAGPTVSANLLAWGARDVVAFRLLLNLAYRWHMVGKSFRPLGRRADGKGKFWGPSADPSHFDQLTEDDWITYAFPDSGTKQRKVLAHRMRKAREVLVKAGEDRYVEGRFMPGWKRG